MAEPSAALLGLDRVGQLGHDLVQVADDPEVGELEDRRVRVLVDRDDVLRGLHPDLVLDRAGDPGREVELGRHRLARLADLGGVRVPAGIDHGTRRGDGAVPAERRGQGLRELEPLGLAEAAAARDEDVGALDVDVRAALDHLGLRRPRRVLDVDVDHLGRAAVLGDRLERVDPPDDDPEVTAILGHGDLGVLEYRALGDQLAVLCPDRDDLHRHPGVLARGQASADLEPEQPAAEQRVGMPVVVDHLGHHVDNRLGKALFAASAEHLGGAVGADRLAQIVGQIVAADHDGVAFAADLGCTRGALGHRPERVLVERALVMQNVDQDIRHQISFLSSSHATIFSTVSFVSSSSMICPAGLASGAWKSPHSTRDPSPPTIDASIPTSPVATFSRGFLRAPMIAFSDGYRGSLIASPTEITAGSPTWTVSYPYSAWRSQRRVGGDSLLTSILITWVSDG